MTELLKYQSMRDNAKLRETLLEFARLTGIDNPVGLAFSLPSGYMCGKVAKECLTYAHPKTGKITRGKDAEFYCFSAISESYSGHARRARWHNWELLEKLWSYAGTDYIDIANFIIESLPKRYNMDICKPDLIRVHVGGEYPGTKFGREYMRAWFYVARVTGIHVYSYTKNVETYLDVRDEQPANFNMTMSRGGLYDHLIDRYRLKHANVIFHPNMANGMPIDHNDINAVFGDHSFNLLLHGTQPAGSDAGKAIKRMARENINFSYSKVGK